MSCKGLVTEMRKELIFYQAHAALPKACRTWDDTAQDLPWAQFSTAGGDHTI